MIPNDGYTRGRKENFRMTFLDYHHIIASSRFLSLQPNLVEIVACSRILRYSKSVQIIKVTDFWTQSVSALLKNSNQSSSFFPNQRNGATPIPFRQES